MAAIRSMRQWYTQSDPALLIKAQDKLLQTFVKASFKRFTPTESTGGLNSVEFTSKSGFKTVILAHGFGSGLGFFFNNVDALLQHPDVGRVVLVDWLGMGGSERPECNLRPIRRITSSCWTSGWCDSRFTPSLAVDFFVDPFAEWMKSAIINVDSTKGDSNVVLVGHSLGGYLAARYVLKHSSQLVTKLVLASPVGFPPRPYNQLQRAQLPTTFRILDALWSANMTPQQLVRIMGSTRGRQSTRRALLGRIPHLVDGNKGSDLVDILADYLYHITVAAPSGEYAMNSLLEPVVSQDTMGVFAREPLEVLFNMSSDPWEPSFPRLRSIKVLFGDHDWMRPNEPSAQRAMQGIQEVSKGKIQISVVTVPHAGHHLYLDNPIDFVRQIVNN